MKIPKTVKIGWRNYTIKFVDEKRDEDGDLLDGQIDHNNHIIYIDNNIIFDDEKLVIFFHEVVHGIFHSQCHYKWEDNENLIQSIAEGLFVLVKDNPKLFSE